MGPCQIHQMTPGGGGQNRQKSHLLFECPLALLISKLSQIIKFTRYEILFLYGGDIKERNLIDFLFQNYTFDRLFFSYSFCDMGLIPFYFTSFPSFLLLGQFQQHFLCSFYANRSQKCKK